MERLAIGKEHKAIALKTFHSTKLPPGCSNDDPSKLNKNQTESTFLDRKEKLDLRKNNYSAVICTQDDSELFGGANTAHSTIPR